MIYSDADESDDSVVNELPTLIPGGRCVHDNGENDDECDESDDDIIDDEMPVVANQMFSISIEIDPEDISTRTVTLVGSNNEQHIWQTCWRLQ